MKLAPSYEDIYQDLKSKINTYVRALQSPENEENARIIASFEAGYSSLEEFAFVPNAKLRKTQIKDFVEECKETLLPALSEEDWGMAKNIYKKLAMQIVANPDFPIKLTIGEESVFLGSDLSENFYKMLLNVRNGSLKLTQAYSFLNENIDDLIIRKALKLTVAEARDNLNMKLTKVDRMMHGFESVSSETKRQKTALDLTSEVAERPIEPSSAVPEKQKKWVDSVTNVPNTRRGVIDL